MVKQITKGQLLNYHNQLESMRGNVSELLLESKIADFRKRFDVRIQSLIDCIRKLEDKYFVVENATEKTRMVKYIPEMKKQESHIVTKKLFGLYKNDKMVMQDVPTGRNIPVMLPDMKMQDYEKELFTLLNETVTSNLVIVVEK